MSGERGSLATAVRSRLYRLRTAFRARNRHRFRARMAGRSRRLALPRRLARLRARDPARPIVGVALVEHLGDIMAAEPVARHLRRTRPEARIVWIVCPAYRELAAAFDAVDETLTVGCLTEWIHLREAASSFDELFDLHLHGRSCAICQVRLERSAARRGATIENYYDVGNLLHAFCLAGGLPGLEDRPRLRPPAGVVERVNDLGLPVPFVTIHGRSNQAVRDWSPGGWGELAGRINSELGLGIVEIGTQRVLVDPPAGALDLTGRTSILESAEIIRRSALFVGIDSGPAHLANAVGTPAVLLLGRYREFEAHMPYSGPWAHGGGGAHILRASGPTSAIDPDRVFDAVRAAARPARNRAAP
ncbi:MAG: glycosyltransferase family 9 protein [Gemmatimonadota bacterium]